LRYRWRRCTLRNRHADDENRSVGDSGDHRALRTYQAVLYVTTYAASKAFDLLFAEGLAQEVQRYGVRVCALCPGPTASEFQKAAGVPDEIVVNVEPAGQVARIGLRALEAGEHSVISGFTNWVGVEVQRIAPRRFVTSAAEILFRPPRRE